MERDAVPRRPDSTLRFGEDSCSSTTSHTVQAYVSIDGTHMLVPYFGYGTDTNVNTNYGDFNSSSFVQGYLSGDYVPTVELRMINASGWGYTGPSSFRTLFYRRRAEHRAALDRVDGGRRDSQRFRQ